MKTIYFLLISLILISCRGNKKTAINTVRIIRAVGSDDNDKKNDVNNYSGIPNGNYTSPSQVNYKPSIPSIDISKINVQMPKVDVNNYSGIPNGNYTSPSQVKYKPSIDISKIKVEMPKMKAHDLKNLIIKLEDYNSKEYRERMVKAMKELDKLEK